MLFVIFVRGSAVQTSCQLCSNQLLCKTVVSVVQTSWPGGCCGKLGSRIVWWCSNLVACCCCRCTCCNCWWWCCCWIWLVWRLLHKPVIQNRFEWRMLHKPVIQNRFEWRLLHKPVIQNRFDGLPKKSFLSWSNDWHKSCYSRLSRLDGLSQSRRWTWQSRRDGEADRNVIRVNLHQSLV